MRSGSQCIAGVTVLAFLTACGGAARSDTLPSVIDTYHVLRPGTHELVTDTTITESGKLICKTGVTITAAAGKALRVYGILRATGTQFEAANPAAKWGGIEFRSNTSSGSVLENCRIEDAGGSGVGAAVACLGGLATFPGPRLSGCTITGSAGDGVRSIGGRPRLANCTISNCAGIGVRNTLGGYVYFGTPCSISGNKKSNMVTFDRRGHGVIFPQVWRPAGRPYRLLGTVGTRRGGRITIRPGVELRMGNAVCLIADRGPINAYGTAGNPIVIRGIGNWRGQWGGIFIKRGGAPAVFRHCRIRNGGANTCCCGKAPHLIALGATRRGGVRVENCSLTSGAGPGIWVEDAIVSLTRSEVSNHSDMGIVVVGTGQLTAQYSTIKANGRAGVYHGGTGSVSLTPNNNLLRNGQFDVVNMSAGDIPAQQDYWGVTTQRAIGNRIYDGRDAAGLGIVRFWPALDSAAGTTLASHTALAITSATAVPSNAGLVQITYALSAAGDVEAEVLNIAGRPVRRLVAQGEGGAGLNTLLWDGNSDLGVSVPPGRYLIRLRATNPDGEQAHATAAVTIAPR